MFTPQQIDQVSFSRATFGGYDMQSVDELLFPLTEDYKTLYKENALLKSKMKGLVNKLEEYRANEASMKDAIINAQKTCDMMVKEAESKCTQMLNEANIAAAENIRKSVTSLKSRIKRKQNRICFICPFFNYISTAAHNIDNEFLARCGHCLDKLNVL